MKTGKFTCMNSNTTTVAHGNSCILQRVIINNAGASANTLTIYDNASAGSGTVVAVIDTVELNGRTLEYGCILQNGCTAVMETGTAADVTIVTA